MKHIAAGSVYVSKGLWLECEGTFEGKHWVDIQDALEIGIFLKCPQHHNIIARREAK